MVVAKPETSSPTAPVDEKEEIHAPEPVTVLSKTQTLVYPHITGELKRIGILATIIFVILIILAILIP